MTQRNRGRRSSRGTKKRTQWVNAGITQVHPVGASIIAADLTPEPMATDETGTAKILRLLLNFNLVMPSVDSVVHRLAVAVLVMTHDAFEGLTFPSPFSGDPSFGWYYYRFASVQHVTSAAPSFSWDADIHTQRVLRAGYKLVLLSETPAQSKTVELEIGFRALWEIN